MRYAIAAVAALVATTVTGSPLHVLKRQETSLNSDLTWISNSSSLPKVILINTGDATALSGSNNGRLDNVNYGGGGPGTVTPEGLIAQVPEVLSIAQIAVINVGTGGGSANAPSFRAVNISQILNVRMCSEGADVVGAVMVHGTNTLADTAFGVDLTLNCTKPFVATGAMRPNSALSADGPMNFYDAVRTAVHPGSVGRGSMIAFADHLISVFYGSKTNGNTISTFLAEDQGYIGQFLAGQPYFFFEPSLPTARNFFDPFSLSLPLPKVDILYAYQDWNADLIYASAASGASGIVLMGTGAGSLSTNATLAATDLFDTQGFITVASLRPTMGAAPPRPQPDKIIRSGFMHGEQSRIQLQLALAAGYDHAGIQTLFEKDIRAAVYNSATAFYNGTNL